MVISCPECSTRFRVDEGKIPAQGAKIRCARCKHIFAVTPPAPEPEPIMEKPVREEPSTTSPRAPEYHSEDKLETPANKDFAAKDSSIDPDLGFGFDDFEKPEIGAGANDEIDPSALDGDDDTAETDDFSFGDEYGNVSLGDEADTENANETFSFGDPDTATDEPPAPTEPATDQKEFSFSPTPENPTDPLADSFQEDPHLNEMPLPPNEDNFNNDEFDASVAPLEKSSSRSPLSVVILFILILTLAILIAGGVMVWKNGPDTLVQLIGNLTGQPQVTKTEGTIRLTNLQGSFMRNRKEGELFVIRGVAINDLSEAQAAIQVKGIIFAKDGRQLLQKTIFCGNPISDDDLRKLRYSKMEEMMGNQFGESLANLNVTPGQSIPFTIVFRKLPKTLSEFVVEVADSKPAAQ